MSGVSCYGVLAGGVLRRPGIPQASVLYWYVTESGKVTGAGGSRFVKQRAQRARTLSLCIAGHVV